MAQPLFRALQDHQGKYDTLFQPGQMLQKGKKGWVISRTRLSSKKKVEFFLQLQDSLSSESFNDVTNPEALIKRINFCIQRPPIPKDFPKVILFKSSSETFAFLSNFFPSLIIYNKRFFRSSEHLYQWEILTLFEPDNANDHFEAMCNLSPLKARKYSHRVQSQFDKTIKAKTKLRVMRTVVTLKFDQNPPLSEALKATHPLNLVENTESDFWGRKVNHMGKILENVRTSLLP